MGTHSSHLLQLAGRRAAFACGRLLDELHLLIGGFPDLRRAFDADALPLAFILRRDSRRTEPGLGLLRPIPVPVHGAGSPRTTMPGTRPHAWWPIRQP
jgi:hypothetical protein